MNQIKEFYEIFLNIWNQGFLGINVGKFINISLALIFFIWFRNKFTSIILEKISKLAEKINARTAISLIKNLEEPVKMIPIVVGFFFVLDYIGFKDGALKIVGERTVKTLISCNIFWGVYVSVAPLSKFLNPLRKIFATEIISWLVKIIKFFIFFFCIATTLEIWGVNVGALIAGLGLLGIAGALGAQDLVKNLISGVLILVEKRFHVGDWILVDGLVEGTVEEIGFRSTLIRRFDKAPVFVPNTKLADAAVTNFTKMTHRRIFFHIGLLYSSTIEQLKNIRERIEKYIINNNDFVSQEEAPAFVRIDKFSNSSIDIMLYCFTKTKNWGEWLKIKEDLSLEIKKIVEEEKSSFAFPSHSLYFENSPFYGEKPEIFIPPQK